MAAVGHGQECFRGGEVAGRPLSLEEAMCPVCLELLLRPVTMPCRHSMCLLCFQRTVEMASLCCPLCRTRVSNWARQRGREQGGLVDAELWEQVRRSHPEKCRLRLLEESGASAEKPEQDFIFQAPIKLSKHGEVREEYESELRKLNEECTYKVASKQLGSSILQEDMQEGKRKIEDQLKEETLTVKLNQAAFHESLSDSENEEPFRGRTAHRSAFCSKSSTYSSTSLAGNTRAARSQSCNDTMKDKSKIRQRALRSNKVKISSVVSASVAGVLLSTENSRSFSAPELTSEKRPSGNVSSSVLQKSERSISPESNDSISEELNHFKPIVCSPCTPPKKLPNGKVLKPVIIKSTPRNLTRNLQTPTSYETSPGVLKKWDTIFQERQAKKTLTQGTLTSFAGEEIRTPDRSKKNRAIVDLNSNLQNNGQFDNFTGSTKPDSLPAINDNPENGAGGESDKSSEALTVQDHTFLLPNAVSRKPSENSQSYSQAEMNAKSKLGDLQICNLTFRKSSLAHRPVTETKEKMLCRHGNNCQQTNMQNGTCGVMTDSNNMETPSSLRRGRKRRCKTKHLDHNGSYKRLKQATNDSGSVVGDLFWGERECKLWQEEEDRKLAFRLQRVFNNEVQTLNRRKGSKDEYHLRSNGTRRASA